MKTLCRVISLLILVILIVLYLPLAIPQLLGYDCSTVITASMEPAIRVGSIVYFKPVEPSKLVPGDVIVYRTSYGVNVSDVTHRVVENNNSERKLVTRGDANPNNDFSPVAYDYVRGLVKGALPFGGNIALFITSEKGKTAMAGLFIPAVLFWLAANSLEPRRRRRY